MTILNVFQSVENITTSNNILLSDFLAPFIVAIAVAIVSAIGNFIFNNKLLYVKEIRKSTDSDVALFVELYNKRIKKEFRICAEEILSYIGKHDECDIQHHLYICKKWDKVVGFIKFMVSKSNKYIFVAYIAIDNNDSAAKKKGVKLLLKKMCKKYFKSRFADKIFIEAERGASGYHSSFSKLVTRYADSKKKRAYILNFDYIQPNMPDDDYTSVAEEKMSLMMVPYYLPSHETISLNKLLEIIHMIYYDIYCPSCNSLTNCCEIDYSKYLETLIDKYKKHLPQTIEMISLNKY